MRVLLIISWGVLLLSSFKKSGEPKLKLPSDFALIPGGAFSMPDNSCCMHDTSIARYTVQKFYLSKFEVSNQRYREFLDDVSPTLTPAARALITCDSSAWNTFRIAANIHFSASSYHRDPAYNEHPVVNISYDAALQYCNWLQQKLQQGNPAYVVEVRLPNKVEWIWAAMGGRSQAMFPWGEYYLTNRKGEPMCNFKQVDEGSLYRNRETGAPVVAPGSDLWLRSIPTRDVKSYTANDYGLYNICGNAAEMVAEKKISMGGSWNDYGGDIQIRREGRYQTSSPSLGFRPLIIITDRP